MLLLVSKFRTIFLESEPILFERSRCSFEFHIDVVISDTRILECFEEYSHCRRHRSISSIIPISFSWKSNPSNKYEYARTMIDDYHEGFNDLLMMIQVLYSPCPMDAFLALTLRRSSSNSSCFSLASARF